MVNPLRSGKALYELFSFWCHFHFPLVCVCGSSICKLEALGLLLH